MGVSVERGRGRGRNLLVDLNLVPFIDFMSCLIAFLMCAAVWTQLAALEVEQGLSTGGDEEPSVQALTVHLRADGLFVGRELAEGTEVPRTPDGNDLTRLAALLAADHAVLPAEDLVVINTDDGVPYGEMVAVLDLSRRLGYAHTLLAGGPASGMPTIAPG